jgi:hypothetical protein
VLGGGSGWVGLGTACASYPWGMGSITLDADLSGAINWSASIARQMPFATSHALNRTAFDIRQQLNHETGRYFDRPTRFTQTAFRVDKSTKQNLSALIYAEDQRARYLRFGVDGGSRPQKGFERKLVVRARGVRVGAGWEVCEAVRVHFAPSPLLFRGI